MKKLSFLILILPCFWSCDDNNSIQLQYRLTSCADEWRFENGSNNDDKARDIKAYLEDEYEIVIDQISVEYFSAYDVTASCFGCECTTGDVVTLKVDEQYEGQLLDLGFIEN